MPESYTLIIFVRGYEQPINLPMITFSICLCLGAARGAWKHAPIILLPICNALIQHAHPVFDIQKHPLLMG